MIRAFFILNAFLLCVAGLMAGCEQKSKAQKIIDQTIAHHGGEHYQQAVIEFDFRKRHYKIALDNGHYQYESWFTDATETGHDILSNTHYIREINGKAMDLSKKDSTKYASSLNSVAYFTLLPYPLNDPAVIKEYLGEATIAGEPYHKVHITFKETKGGKDFEDVFVYWFHQQTHQMDYLAYKYQTDEGGSRFRKAINPRTINGIYFADYINYEGPYPVESINDFDELFEQGALNELSRIELRNIVVELL